MACRAPLCTLAAVSHLLDLPSDVPRRSRRRPPRRALRLVVALAVLVVLLAAALVGGTLLLDRLRSPSVLDYEGAGTGRVVVVVRPGQTAAAVGQTLTTAGVVRSTAAFNAAAAGDPDSRRLQPGTYTLRKQMSGSAALALLLDPDSRLLARVTLPEGSSLAQSLTAITKATGLKAADLKAAVEKPAALGLPPYAKGQVEGFLFPATYDVEPGTTGVQLLKTMVDRYKQAAASLDLAAEAQAQGRTPYEVLTVASLIEKETAFPADRPKVARVAYNRLEKGMMLQFDSTVNYLKQEKTARLTLDDLKVDSDYNTYQVTGLPPTPIGSPGAAALKAALEPASGDYVYFITVSTTGQALFTADYEEFKAAKAKAKADGVY